MYNTLQVRWTIIPQTPPQPWIACGGCGGMRAFQSSGKIRLNANGRKLDAWLIYKCIACEKTWNRPIFERQNVRDIDPDIHEAFQSNDPEWIRAETFNLQALRRKAQRVDEFDDYIIEKATVHEVTDWTKLVIELAVMNPTSTRLDRLLASELRISRSRLQTLNEKGFLQSTSDRSDAMRRRVKTGTLVTIDLSKEADREQSWKPLATGGPL
ncbi:DUF1062 domain-containing protein [Agrobacterium tumefaciens]|uniref:DUF1062 domain-containing protein n=1 Tax=Agrobacterium tumefaciens TaxID=358 RepID=UPI0015722BAD|nr:DUF1062 domain-containing protein [Agrobacterium tumefaciens]NSZ66057.1 DUF1062 domain-containing protein [Agrobacterium tumefaciens]NTA72428.1 DUF1062 domain-containing protein [Agrobacterium tumefaciens]